MTNESTFLFLTKQTTYDILHSKSYADENSTFLLMFFWILKLKNVSSPPTSMQDSLLGDDDEKDVSLVLNTAFCNTSALSTQMSTTFNQKPESFNQARSALHQTQTSVQLAVKNFPPEFGKRQSHKCFICGQSDHEAKECKINVCYFCGTYNCECNSTATIKETYEQNCFRCASRNHCSCQCNIPLKLPWNGLCVYCGITGHTVRQCGIFKRITSKRMPIFVAGQNKSQQQQLQRLQQEKTQSNQQNMQTKDRFQERYTQLKKQEYTMAKLQGRIDQNREEIQMFPGNRQINQFFNVPKRDMRKIRGNGRHK